jgi:hypothetical protein
VKPSLAPELPGTAIAGFHVVNVNPFATDTPFFVHEDNYSIHPPRMIPKRYAVVGVQL